MNLELPPSMLSRHHSPTPAELEFMCAWCRNYIRTGASVLEFGAGVTTWVIYNAIKPSFYVAVEDWQSNIDKVNEHIDDIRFIQTSWHDIPERMYDFVFVDSSSGFPGKSQRGLHRLEAVQFADPLVAKYGFIMIHDWHGRSGRGPRSYLDKSPDYQLVSKHKDRTGVGVYRKMR